MKKTISFDTETDTYEAVLEQVKEAYGFRTWSQPDVDLWVSLMAEEQVAFVSLLAWSEVDAVSAETTRRGLSGTAPRTRDVWPDSVPASAAQPRTALATARRSSLFSRLRCTGSIRQLPSSS
ncbi:hypothetical protein [Streptomyces botrytidirepellens]|uniref:Uncharacterized protein n=1 Tax=Streptomyces botrytidirepellens TaxID=2486417 RepID=A0A3M8SK34_9ACTN|nr:hypothetical protein [Streptomyces botrytidirepellens]RNF81153.1 hypothetical protein EEJ42_47070 [Streptomyces botrytidirepellens]